jgi:hypothetical protein
MLEKTVEQAVLGLQQDGQLAAIEVNAAAISAPVNANNLFEPLFGQGRAAFWTSHPVLSQPVFVREFLFRLVRIRTELSQKLSVFPEEVFLLLAVAEMSQFILDLFHNSPP